MNKHTPGPWQAVPLAERTMWGVVADMGGPGKTFITITSLDHVPADIPASEANAILMAAAPELLHALKTMLESHGTHGPCRNNGCSDCKYARREARAAINKAEPTI